MAEATLQAGSMVWFVPYREGDETCCHLAAIVAKVNEDGSANLCVFTEEGRPISHQAIPFVKEDDAPDSDFCCLMHPEGKKPVAKSKNKAKK